MGKFFLDQYSLLHFAVGIVAYFWGFDLVFFFLVHFLFEVLENTKTGIMIIDNYLTWWPGGKLGPDSLSNIVGDNVSAVLGWYAAKMLDSYGSRQGWYFPHLPR